MASNKINPKTTAQSSDVEQTLNREQNERILRRIRRKKHCYARYVSQTAILSGESGVLKYPPPNLLYPPYIPTPIPVTSLEYYPPYMPQAYDYPTNNWNPILASLQYQNPIFNTPMPPLPVDVPPFFPPILPPILPPFSPSILSPVLPPVLPPILPQACSYAGGVLTTHPFMAEPIMPNLPLDVQAIFNNYYDPFSHFEPIALPSHNSSFSEDFTQTPATNIVQQNVDPLEFYLKLPKEIFPTARMLKVDPNPIIDELCKVKDIHNEEPWILDIEFGVPRLPVSRPIAIYDVRTNSVICRNRPGAIYPSFETCSDDLKRVIRLYYECIISGWYKGYISLKYDTSVPNFQSWLSLPMQDFGMCWP